MIIKNQTFTKKLNEKTIISNPDRISFGYQQKYLMN